MSKLYELVGASDRRFSPYCWRSRMALLHKGLDYQTVPCRFTQKDRIAFSNQQKVPVLNDDGAVVSDSWAIACHLEDAYPDRPSLFGGPVGRSLSRLTNLWVDRQINTGIARLIINDVFDRVAPEDKEYFRRTREAALGDTLENLHASRDAHRHTLDERLAVIEAQLTENHYLAGEEPAYADYVLFGTLQWARLTSPMPLLENQPALASWFDGLLDRFDGAGRTQEAAVA